MNSSNRAPDRAKLFPVRGRTGRRRFQGAPPVRRGKDRAYLTSKKYQLFNLSSPHGNPLKVIDPPPKSIPKCVFAGK
jgi:hypothetical protein